ncbi:PLP-dependent cysteine synthase family protein [Streptomyces sp. NBC_01298]|uniref:PLP-dependent cysteine synthase family protein n=1 Tax=unclassified Streptomyces TaxID=2593676 RepID=UPI00224E5B15|nr:MULTISPECIES: PLP-dependent cysteine synthase family protein [unclassified Streptomyces]MCX5404034.1 PLP-dependent cysteine synthase family protein [Streptomyces sp. NBC_00086]WSK19860.1 PLP-dependent cysteine synthase family protein [Streptomyces sp. NBC_01298]
MNRLPLLEDFGPLSPAAHAPVPVIARRPAQLVGNTPVLWIDEPFAPPGRGFFAKLEGANPGGIKDRPGLHMVRQARLRGDLLPGAPIVESSSGTLGLGLTLAGLTYGHPVTVVSDPGMEPAVVRLLTALGAYVDQVETPHPTGGWQEARRERVAELLTAAPGAYCPDQYSNPDNVGAYRPLAAELIAQLGRIDVLVTAVGTGGHSAGIAAGLREHSPGLRLIGVDSINSAIFGQPAGPRLMRGLGSSIHPANVDYKAFAEVHWVAPGEAVWACRRLARRHYASGGWSVGAVALVAGWAARTMPPGTRIAAVFPDGPHRYLETVYNDAWCAEQGILGAEPAAEPEEIAAPDACTVTGWTRSTQVRDPLGRKPGPRAIRTAGAR